MSIFNRSKLREQYISEIDKFLIRFDKENLSTSKSQQDEIENYRIIFDRRDNKL